MNQLVTQQPGKTSLVDIRTDDKKFPRIYTYRREEVIYQMNMIIMMAFQFRGQSADSQTIVQMSASLIDILIEDEYEIGTKYLTIEEIRRVVKRAALGQGREMYGISVSSLLQALADYCKGEGRMADQEAKEIASKRKSIKDSIIAPMIDSMAAQMVKR
jgi:hypothetical protein